MTIIAPAMAVRAGLRVLLSDDPDIQIIAEAGNMVEIEKLNLGVDVVIWSPEPSFDQEPILTQLSNIKIGESVGLLLIHNDPEVMEPLSRLTTRSWGMLDQEATQQELIASVHALHEGLVVTSPVWLKQGLLNHSTNKDANHDLVEPLTEREVEILQLLAYGLTNKQIASRLKISAHTVKFHVSTIFNKLGTTNRVETVNLGLKKGLILL